MFISVSFDRTKLYCEISNNTIVLNKPDSGTRTTFKSLIGSNKVLYTITDQLLYLIIYTDININPSYISEELGSEFWRKFIAIFSGILTTAEITNIQLLYR